MKSFFLSPVSKQYNLQVPESLRNANSSFILYEKIKEHINYCNSCNENTEILTSRCLLLKQILYPYGLYISDDVKKQFFLHKGLNLDNWCIPCKEEEIDEKNNILHKNKINYKSNLFLNETGKLYKRCLKKDGLCKCTSNLFVGSFNEKVERKKQKLTRDRRHPEKMQRENKHTEHRQPPIWQLENKETIVFPQQIFNSKGDYIYNTIKETLNHHRADNNSLVLVNEIMNNIMELGKAQKEDLIKKVTEEQEVDYIKNSEIYKIIKKLINISINESNDEFIEYYRLNKLDLNELIFKLNKKVKCEINFIYIDYLKTCLHVIILIYDKICEIDNLNNASNVYRKDSVILNDLVKLKEHLKTLNNTILNENKISIADINLKPEFRIYHERYGIPNKLIYDPIFLSTIKQELQVIL